MFKGNKNLSETTVHNSTNTYIAEEIEITGNFKGKGSIQVEGTIHGNVSVTSIVIGEKGTINGTINATNVIVNGKLNGSIFCDTLEVMKNGQVSDDIKVKQLLISGKAEGSITSKEEITIDSTGIVTATLLSSKTIMVNGTFNGGITASQLLHIGATGSVEGEITVKNIKTEEGGRLLGSIHTYVEESNAKQIEIAQKDVSKA